jgi:hypothetical protein
MYEIEPFLFKPATFLRSSLGARIRSPLGAFVATSPRVSLTPFFKLEVPIPPADVTDVQWQVITDYAGAPSALIERRFVVNGVTRFSGSQSASDFDTLGDPPELLEYWVTNDSWLTSAGSGVGRVTRNWVSNYGWNTIDINAQFSLPSASFVTETFGSGSINSHDYASPQRDATPTIIAAGNWNAFFTEMLPASDADPVLEAFSDYVAAALTVDFSGYIAYTYQDNLSTLQAEDDTEYADLLQHIEDTTGEALDTLKAALVDAGEDVTTGHLASAQWATPVFDWISVNLSYPSAGVMNFSNARRFYWDDDVLKTETLPLGWVNGFTVSKDFGERVILELPTRPQLDRRYGEESPRINSWMHNAASQWVGVRSAVINDKFIGNSPSRLYRAVWRKLFAPTVVIQGAPDIYRSTDSIELTAVATDHLDGSISSSVVWTSDLDGQVGTGANLSTTLSEGPHTITATATNSDGVAAQDTFDLYVGIEITMIEPEQAPAGFESLEVSGFGFDQSTLSVIFGAAASPTVTVESKILAVVTVPAGTGTVDVTVSNGVDEDTLTDAFTYISVVTVEITAPADSSSHSSASPITFEATASSSVDGDISSSVTWSARPLDEFGEPDFGEDAINMGAGASIEYTLPAATYGYRITANVVDSTGARNNDTIDITVT